MNGRSRKITFRLETAQEYFIGFREGTTFAFTTHFLFSKIRLPTKLFHTEKHIYKGGGNKAKQKVRVWQSDRQKQSCSV